MVVELVAGYRSLSKLERCRNGGIKDEAQTALFKDPVRTAQ